MTKSILMCPPNYFDIEYEINAWMHQADPVVAKLAKQQWKNLSSIYTERLGWDVELIEPQPGLPDMVFATDSCLIINNKICLSNFRCPERQPETQYYENWFRDHGYSQIKQARHRFEGGGDNLICGSKLLSGYGFRSAIEAHAELREYFDLEVISLRLIDPKYFHLDTAIAVLNTDTVAFFPNALDKPSQRHLKAAIPNIIEATAEEAAGFGLNAVSDGQTVITSNASASLLQKYQAAGFSVIGTPILEFRKAGGGVKCLTLNLNN
jgi:N-dimethylarginine dimethylaminohydrolase